MAARRGSWFNAPRAIISIDQITAKKKLPLVKDLPEGAKSVFEEVCMETPVLIVSEEILLAGFSFFGNPLEGNAGWTEDNEIGRLWNRLYSTLHAIPLPEEIVVNKRHNFEAHLLHEDTEKTGEYEVFVGLQVSDVSRVPIQYCVKVLPAATYAVFTARGKAEIMMEEPLIDRWLVKNDYEMAHQVWVQRYDERFLGLERMEESELDWMVPIRKGQR